jgi:type IV pilus assembly protein PilV
MKDLHRRRVAGFSLIEVLIALVILSVGLLGIAAMVSTSLKSKDSSYYHTEALALTNAIMDRMRANHDTATANGYDVNFGGTPTGGSANTNCTSAGPPPCTTAQIAAMDVAQWQNDIGLILPPFSSSVPAAGSISTTTVNQMTQVNVSIRWNDLRANQAVGASTSAAPIPTTSAIQITSGL